LSGNQPFVEHGAQKLIWHQTRSRSRSAICGRRCNPSRPSSEDDGEDRRLYQTPLNWTRSAPGCRRRSNRRPNTKCNCRLPQSVGGTGLTNASPKPAPPRSGGSS
jgi:hypothetical protein